MVSASSAGFYNHVYYLIYIYICVYSLYTVYTVFHARRQRTELYANQYFFYNFGSFQQKVVPFSTFCGNISASYLFLKLIVFIFTVSWIPQIRSKPVIIYASIRTNILPNIGQCPSLGPDERPGIKTLLNRPR